MRKKRRRIITLLGLAGLLGMIITPSPILYNRPVAPCEKSVNSSAGWEFNIPPITLPPNPSLPVSTGGEEVQPLERQAQNPASSPTPTGAGMDYANEMQQLDTDIHNWYADQAVEQEKERQREDLTHRMRHYCIERHFRQDVIDRIPTMIELGYQTANDPRICIVTCHLESSGGRGATNLFGVLSWINNTPDIDHQIDYYFQQITSYGFNGDVWQIAYKWYGYCAKGVSYANGVLADVQAI